MSILYRTIIREISALFLAITLVLLTIIMSFRLSSLLGQAATGKVSLSAVWQLLGLQAINMLGFLIPVALILSCVMSLARLYRDHEADAIFSAGISRFSLYRPIFILSIMVGAFLLYLSLAITPDIYRRSDALRSIAQQQASFALLSPNAFRALDTHTTLYTGAQKEHIFKDFFFYQNNEKGHQLVFADDADFQQNNHERFLILGRGIRLAWPDSFSSKDVSYAQFSKAKIYLEDAQNVARQRLRARPTLELDRSAQHQAELQKRINPTLAMLIFCLAIPLIVHTPPRKKNTQRLLPAFLAFAFYINILDFITTLISKGKIAIFPGSVWVHGSVLTLIILAWYLKREEV